MVARGEYAAAALPEPRDAPTVGLGQSVARVHREEPELVEVRRVEAAQDFVVAFGVSLSVSRDDFASRTAFVVPERAEVLAQQRKPSDVPVVLDGRDGRLQKDAYGSAHKSPFAAIGVTRTA